jgi:hypothetical protein
METVIMIPLATPGLLALIVTVGAALAGMMWKQPTPKQVPVKARRARDGQRLS